MLGVLVVIVILALAILPALMKQADMTARDVEVKSQQSIVGGLQTCVVKTRIIPGADTIPQAVAAQLGWLTADVTSNARGQPRYFIVDPALRVGTSTGTLPYVQNTNGSILPVNPRLMVISSMGQPLPTAVSSGPATSAAVFEQIWNSADKVAPTGWTSGGVWEDIVIQRLNLGLLFTQVILNNSPASLTPTNKLGRYSLDNTNNHVFLPSVPFSAYFLKGTALGLHSSAGALQVLQVLQDCPQLTNGAPYFISPSYVYEQGLWRGKLFMAPNSGLVRCGSDLQAAYEVFMSGPPNVYKVGSVTQNTLTWSMYLFMSNYVNWASADFPAGALATAVTDSQEAMAAELGVYSDKKAQVGP
jgi:hypothetical protein